MCLAYLESQPGKLLHYSLDRYTFGGLPDLGRAQPRGSLYLGVCGLARANSTCYWMSANSCCISALLRFARTSTFIVFTGIIVFFSQEDYQISMPVGPV